ncbi:MAG: cell division protein FtsH, partial [Alphaproteobacteria bacterium]
QQKHMSDHTADLIDTEVRRLIEEAEDNARRILTERRDDLETITKALLEYETLSGDEVNALLRGEDIFRPDAEDPPAGACRKSSVPTSGKKSRGEGDEPGGMEPEPQGT